jgi:uncharacterized protein (TIGR02391 family)
MALLEGWGWLISSGLIIPHPDGGPSYTLSRRGAALPTEDAVGKYRDDGILPVGLLHPRIASDVRSHFVREHFDTAVFHAFKEVEIAMREASDAPSDYTGDKVARFAFAPDKGPLRDESKVDSERLAEAHLFAGAIGCVKNPGSHRHVNVVRGEAARLIIFASHLLFLIDERKAQKE